jgi:hypothetical protein
MKSLFYLLTVMLWFFERNSSSKRLSFLSHCIFVFSGILHVQCRLHVARKHEKKIPCYKRYKNLRIFLDEKAKCQPWIIKKEPKIG